MPGFFGSISGTAGDVALFGTQDYRMFSADRPADSRAKTTVDKSCMVAYVSVFFASYPHMSQS